MFRKVGSAANPSNNSKDGQLIMAGFALIPVKGIKISPNYQLRSPADNSISIGNLPER